ncbi:competence protein CoiA [Halobacillus seohaensis]|uniref:Competence protein CoiA n=1 Tax=Halobacillus seohaensis TaxID=447421 RepID=A0ABW2EKD9_9BACI
MFYANDENGTLTSIYQKPKSTLQQLKKQTTFYCPICNEALIIRLGNTMTPHFAHLPSSQCEMKQRGESDYHDSGKWLLYQWLKNQGYDVKVEAYVPEIKQRPDLLFTVNDKRIAVELQCATIPTDQVESRTKGYHAEGIFPLWILGSNQLQRKGKYQISNHSFHKSLLYSFHNQYRMYFLDVTAETIVIVNRIIGSSATNSFATFKKLPLTKLRFPQLFTPTNSSLTPFYKMWEQQMYRYRTLYKKDTGSKERQWRQYVYLKGFHFSLIPSFCFLPVKSQSMVFDQPYMWQTRFIIDHIMSKQNGERITVPKIPSQATANLYVPKVIEEYLLILEELEIVYRQDKQTWVKMQDIVFHKTVEEAVSEDHRVINKLKLHNHL